MATMRQSQPPLVCGPCLVTPPKTVYMSAAEAALSAGFTRFRPVLMTALAMIIGMVPMALGLGDGGEQNAPLGRAVIGGLLLATIATLTFVPVFFSLVHRNDMLIEQPAGNTDE